MVLYSIFETDWRFYTLVDETGVMLLNLGRAFAAPKCNRMLRV